MLQHLKAQNMQRLEAKHAAMLAQQATAAATAAAGGPQQVTEATAAAAAADSDPGRLQALVIACQLQM
jgi:hypothetical protein